MCANRNSSLPSDSPNNVSVADQLKQTLLLYTKDAMLIMSGDTFKVVEFNAHALALYPKIKDLRGTTLSDLIDNGPSQKELSEAIDNDGVWKYNGTLKTNEDQLAQVILTCIEHNEKHWLVIRIYPTEKIVEGETEKRLSTILESINEIVYNISISDDGSRIIEYISPQIKNIFGFTDEEYTSTSASTFIEHYHPDDLKNIQKLSEEMRATGKVLSVVYRFRPKGKEEYIWVEEKIFPKYDEDGKHLANFGLIRDVTSRILAEQRLKDSEERWRLLSEAALEGILFSKDGKVIDANDQFAQMFGYASSEEVRGMEVNSFVHPNDKAKVEHLISIDSEDKFEAQCVKKDGSIIVVESKGRLTPHEGLKMRVSVVIDITESKKQVEELAKSQESYRNLVHFSPNGIVIHFDDEIEYANPGALKLLGYNDFKDLKGKKLSELVLPEYRDIILKRIAKLKDDADEVELEEIHLKRLDGKIMDIGIQSVKTTYDGRQGIQVILLDLEYQKQLAAEQLRAQIAEETNVHLEEEIQRHKQTQGRLGEAQKFTKSLISSSLDMIMATDINDTVTEFNPAAIEQFGYELDEIIGMNPLDLYADAKSHTDVHKSLKESGVFSGEVLNRRKDGSTFISYLAASQIRNEKGELQGAMGISRDISEAKKAEKKITEQSAKINAIFQSSSHLIWSVDRKKRLTSFNKNFSDTLVEVYSIRPRIGHSIITDESFTTREYNRLWDRKYDQTLAGKPQHFETSLVDMNGKERWQEIYLNPILDQDGSVAEVSGIGQDITYKKEAERKIKDQGAKINSIFESTSHMMIWTLDKHFRITSFNRNFARSCDRLMGVQVEEGMDFREIIRTATSDEDYDDLIQSIQNAIKGKPQLFEGQLNGQQRDNFWIETFLNPIYLELGKIREISCLAHEITEKKESEQQIKQSLSEKEVLLKEVHHRVKNNLQVISSILNLQSSYVKDQNTLDILRESQNRIKSMSFIHESLYQTKNFSSIDFSDYIRNLSKNLVHSYRVYNELVDLDLDIDKVYLNLDQAIPCGLIVNELVSNSLKYAFTEGSSGKITVGLSENDKKVQLRVEDTGIGLEKDFDFRNTDSLGLQLVVTLVEQLDGEIELVSDKGKGTKYLITFGQLS